MLAWSLIDEDGDAVLSVLAADWMGRGACASGGQMLDDFFVEEMSDGNATEQVLAAKRYCAGCPVRPECLTWAMELESGTDYRSGIFGGLSPNERMLADQASDPIAFGLRVLEEQVLRGLVLMRVPRYEEEESDHLSGTR